MSIQLQAYKQDRKEAHENPAYSSSHDNVVGHVPEKTSTAYEIANNASSVVEIDDLSHEKLPVERNAFNQYVHVFQSSTRGALRKYKRYIIAAILILFFLGYLAYFGYAMYYEFGSEKSIRLLWMTILLVLGVAWYFFWKFCGTYVTECFEPCTNALSKHGGTISWIVLGLVYLFVIVFIIVDTVELSKDYYNLVSLGGLAFYVLIFYIFSYSPEHVNFRAVGWGLGMQFVFAILILRWSVGYDVFKWLGDRVTSFLSHSDAGAAFLFGPGFREHFFAFAVLPVIIYFSTVISVLYYLGVMQWVVQKIGYALQALMGTTAGESLNAAGNIFIGQSEAPLMIKPLIGDMTRSELHAVMTGGFATIAGSVLAAYILFGAPANHLISASVMSAPAALAMSKLIYPETEVSKTTAEDVKSMEKSPERNLIEAASSGASQSIKLVANIAVNLIAFIAILDFLNATLTWFGNRAGMYDPPLTFELICSYVLFPLSLFMGVELDDCRKVAELIGVKTFLNEFVAYDRLGKLIGNKADFYNHTDNYNGTWYKHNDDIILEALPDGTYNQSTLVGGYLSDRSEVISTYALCGFSNFGSMGIMLGALGAMAPHRKRDLASIVLSAMIAGNVACFMTACIAGLFYQSD